MSTNYVNTGAARQLGRFGLIAAGAVIALTDAEVANLAADSVLKPVPVPTRSVKRVTANTTLTNDDSGKQIRCNHSSGIKLTLPASPTAGVNYEIAFGDAAAAANVTVEPGESYTITGEAVDYRIASIGSITAGTGYTSLPTFGVTGGTGSGATLVGHMKALTATPSAAGTGYNVGNTITLAGGTGTAPVVTVATVKTVSAAVVAGGAGYAVDDILTVVGGTGTATQLRVTAETGGVIDTVSVEVAGSYTVKPTNAVAVTGGGGADATFNLTVGVLTATVTTAGDLTALASNPAAQSSTSGSGTGATFTMTYGLLSVSVTAGGEGYGVGDSVSLTVTGGGGSSAAGTATLSAIPGNLVLEPSDEKVNIYFNGTGWVTV